MLDRQEYESRSAGSAVFGKALNYGKRLFQPQYWPELRRMAAKRLRNETFDFTQIEQARAHAADIAIDAPEAFARLGLNPLRIPLLVEDHPERLSVARARVEAARSTMGGGVDPDLLYGICLASGARRALETGVAFGWSTLAILSAIENRPDSGLVSVDRPYLGANLDDLVGIAVPEELKPLWTLLRGADRDRLEEAIRLSEPLDLAHYDSDKSESGRLWAYPLIWDGLRDNGILMSDDIEDNFAFFDFAIAVGVEPIVVQDATGGKFTGILKKA